MALPVRENKMTTDRKLILATCAVVMALTSPLRADSGHAAPRSPQQSHPLAATSSIDWTHDVTFAYDTSGNIKAIGADRYYYGTGGRVGYGSVRGAPNLKGMGTNPSGTQFTAPSATTAAGKAGW